MGISIGDLRFLTIRHQDAWDHRTHADPMDSVIGSISMSRFALLPPVVCWPILLYGSLTILYSVLIRVVH